MLQKPFSQQNPIGMGSLAQKGVFQNALIVKMETLNYWIVDSGASDHMTGDANLFHTFSPCQENLTINIADGSLSKVIGIGSISLTKNLIFNSALLVPKLDCNLLFISKLSRDKNCVAKFFSHYCVFQDLDLGKMISNAELSSRLYLFEATKTLVRQPQKPVCILQNKQSFSIVKSTSDDDVMLWHYRLGHPSFMYLEKLFPSLFSNKSSNFFNCDICQLAKNIPIAHTQISHTSHLICFQLFTVMCRDHQELITSLVLGGFFHLYMITLH